MQHKHICHCKPVWTIVWMQGYAHVVSDSGRLSSEGSWLHGCPQGTGDQGTKGPRGPWSLLLLHMCSESHLEMGKGFFLQEKRVLSLIINRFLL